ncbi:MAG: pyridoxamine 5'-phosphate oxidase [Thermoanaerobaculia bacterium]
MHELKESDLDPDPYRQFDRWFAQAREAQPILPEAMTVATAGNDGVVSSRVCLLKDVDRRGFVFYTNYDSRKGHQIHENPWVSLCFFWPTLERQVRVEGVAIKTTEEESEEYFATRPRGSQLGAWASNQSQVIMGRGELEGKVAEMDATYRDRPVPRPPYWGGYRVIPIFVEFWQGREDRLHDRFVYRLRDAKDWVIERQSP